MTISFNVFLANAMRIFGFRLGSRNPHLVRLSTLMTSLFIIWHYESEECGDVKMIASGTFIMFPYVLQRGTNIFSHHYCLYFFDDLVNFSHEIESHLSQVTKQNFFDKVPRKLFAYLV